MAAGGSGKHVALWESNTSVRPFIKKRVSKTDGRCIFNGYLMIGGRAISSNVWCLAFQPEKKILATAGDDEIIYMWDLDTYQPLVGREKLLVMKILS